MRFFQTFEQTVDIHQNKQQNPKLNSIILRFIETFEQTEDIHENK